MIDAHGASIYTAESVCFVFSVACCAVSPIDLNVPMKAPRKAAIPSCDVEPASNISGAALVSQKKAGSTAWSTLQYINRRICYFFSIRIQRRALLYIGGTLTSFTSLS